MTDRHDTNTLNMRERELHGLLASMDGSTRSAPGKKGRIYSRWQFRQQSVRVRILQPGGSEMEARMACRNLSKGGIGLLHRSYVHIGTECVVTVAHPMKGDQDYRGKVVRCLHFSGMVHEIGIAFDEEIPLRDIACPDPMQEIFAIESVDPETLVGTVLLIEDSEMDVQLVKHFLKGSQVRVKHALTIAEAEKQVRGGVGLVLCDIHLGDENGGDFARKLHETSAHHAPIVMISADRAQETSELINRPYIKGFLGKPFSQDALLRTIGEFMIDPVAAESSKDSNSIEGDSQITAMLLPELVKTCERLTQAAEANDTTLTLSLLMQLSGVAPVLGLNELAMLAETMSQQLAAAMDLQKITSRINDVVRLCDEAARHG